MPVHQSRMGEAGKREEGPVGGSFSQMNKVCSWPGGVAVAEEPSEILHIPLLSNSSKICVGVRNDQEFSSDLQKCPFLRGKKT